ncbi:MAG TPA: phospholipase D family protein [Ramlibacter sp.]|uniref:phospholipase D family protein n=1 Tax=Ramlibacter sp. TaxID=1917967 RepID=UPI002D411700|nr:phospholipase D family protein [Ramlibacter sp.]HZY17803.1 phospholipase D family protein [Ramlibacter sp.]
MVRLLQNGVPITSKCSDQQMAKFLNTSATNYFLEELIKSATDRLILISPFLKLNDRIKELLADKNRLKIDVRIVYGKSELQPQEIEWLRGLTYVRTSFCKNLHAKCYLSESLCIVTSLNLYEFSQVNNNEMGVLIERVEDAQLYKDAYEEAQRIIRISDEVRITMERVTSSAVESSEAVADVVTEGEPTSGGKLPSSKIAQKHGLKTSQLLERATAAGYLALEGDRHALTLKGQQSGVELVAKSRFGPYFLWPEDINLG